jgi:hypothetical protein
MMRVPVTGQCVPALSALHMLDLVCPFDPNRDEQADGGVCHDDKAVCQAFCVRSSR